MIRTMSVVATTFGIGARTRRPAIASAASAATRATKRALGRERSYHQKPATTISPSPANTAACQLIAAPRRPSAAPARVRAGRAARLPVRE